MLRSLASAILVLAPIGALAQWTDVRQLGIGGESTVATDGKGSVWVTGHLPCALYTSRDWGQSFVKTQEFPEGLGDMLALSSPGGRLNLALLPQKLDGVRTWYSGDNGATLSGGSAPKGPLDREWMAARPDGSLSLIYSNGFIGGPKSKGVFIAGSTDGGKSFAELSRIDREAEGSYPVDPFLCASAKGRLYAMWMTSTDYNNLDGLRFAWSDTMKDFQGHQTIATFSPSVNGHKVDTQERWMLPTITAFGNGGVLIAYPSYETVDVDGEKEIAMLLRYRVSEDAGATFGEPRRVLSETELAAAIRSNRRARKSDDAYPYYIQILPWACSDPKGRVHLVFTDNRLGQTLINHSPLNRWQSHLATLTAASDGFAPTEIVSSEYRARRTPMDFQCCIADSRYVYVSWTTNDGSFEDWPKATAALFTGKLWLARKPLP